MKESTKPTPSLRLPIQSPSVSRNLIASSGWDSRAGVEASQTHCDNLTGPAQQWCYALEYGVSL